MRVRSLLTSRFLRDSSALQVAALWRLGGSLVSAVALTHLLGARRQGEYLVAVAVYSLLWLVGSIGVLPVAVSGIARTIARRAGPDPARWLAFLTKALLIIGVGVATLGWLTSPWIVRVALQGEPRIALWGAALTLTPLLELPRIVLGASLQGTRRMGALARLEIGHEAARLFLVIGGALATGDAAGPVAGSLLASLLSGPLALAVYARERARGSFSLPAVRAILRELPHAPLRMGLRRGARIGLVRNAQVLSKDVLPALFLARFGTADSVAYLRLAQRVTQTAMLFAQGTSRTALPALTTRVADGDLRGLSRTFMRASLLGAASVSGAYIAALVLLPIVLPRLVPMDYREPVWINCLILGPGLVLTSFAAASEAFHIATDTLRAAFRMTVGSVVLQALVVGLLVGRWPVLGVTWGASAGLGWTFVHPVYGWSWLRRAERRGQS